MTRGVEPDATVTAGDMTNLREAVITAVVEAYYPEAVRVGSMARARAQMAQTAVSLFAAGAVATLTLTALQDKPWPVRALACVAIGAWLASAVAYTRAVGAPVVFDQETVRARTGADFVDIVLQRALAEKKHVDARQRWAGALAVVALAATALTVGTALFTGQAAEEQAATLTLTSDGRRAVTDLCGGLVDTLEGRIQSAPSDPRTITFFPDARSCGSGRSELVIERSLVTAVLIVEEDR